MQQRLKLTRVTFTIRLQTEVLQNFPCPVGMVNKQKLKMPYSKSGTGKRNCREQGKKGLQITTLELLYAIYFRGRPQGRSFQSNFKGNTSGHSLVTGAQVQRLIVICDMVTYYIVSCASLWFYRILVCVILLYCCVHKHITCKRYMCFVRTEQSNPVGSVAF